MAEKTLLTYRGAASLYFILGLVFLFGEYAAIGVVFFILGLSLLVRTNDRVDDLAQYRPVLVWAPFVAVLLLSLFIVAITLVIPLF